MDRIIRDIFETYINLDEYQERINKNPDYKLAIKNIGVAEENFLKTLEEYGEDMPIKLFDAYMELSNVYRYHDFSFGFMTGIILGMQMNKNENNEFIQYCKDNISSDADVEF